MKLVDEIGVMHKRPCHLETLETGSEDFFHLVLRDEASDIDERQFQHLTELHGVFQEIPLLVRNCRNQKPSDSEQGRFQPPELLHVHVVGESLEGHRAAHHLHRSLAHEAC